MTDTPIAIIGAGLAGLTAARTIQSAGIDPIVLEAAERVGGRIDCLRDKDGAPVADLGPTWVWPPFQPAVPRWLSTLTVESFDQYDAGDAILDGFEDNPVRQPLPGQYGMARLVGGPSALIDAMAAGLSDGFIRTKTPVSAVQQRKDGSLLIEGDNGFTLSADRVIIATSLRLAAERISLPEALPEPLHEALKKTPTWMAAQAKAVIRYDRPFWREQGLSGRIASRQGPLFEAHDHTSAQGDAALFGFIGTPVGHRDPALLEPAILAQLERCLGPEGSQPIALVIRDWAQDETICSEADRMGPQAHPSVGPERLRSGHLDERLWFCAAETAAQSPGLIEGALLAGEAAGQAASAGLVRDVAGDPR